MNKYHMITYQMKSCITKRRNQQPTKTLRLAVLVLSMHHHADKINRVHLQLRKRHLILCDVTMADDDARDEIRLWKELRQVRCQIERTGGQGVAVEWESLSKVEMEVVERTGPVVRQWPFLKLQQARRRRPAA